MAAGTATALIERQVDGFNKGNLDDVVAGYADDARLFVVSPHTLPGNVWKVEGKEGITKHMGRVLKGGIADVAIDWVGGGEDFLAWRDSGQFWGTTAFSESHTAQLNDAGEIIEHWIHSVYEKP